jgi:hypothetical protein
MKITPQTTGFHTQCLDCSQCISISVSTKGGRKRRVVRALLHLSSNKEIQMQILWRLRRWKEPEAAKVLPSTCSIIPDCALLLSSFPTLNVSTVQYSVSIIVTGVVFIEERVCRLLNQRLENMRAISAYNGVALGGAWILDSWV